MEPVVSSCIPLPQKLYNITRRLRTVQEEVEIYFPGFKAFIDSTTEQEIQRPKDKRKERGKTITLVRRRKTIP